MIKRLVVSVVLCAFVFIGCGSNGVQTADTSELTETTTAAVEVPAISVNAETISAYGQLLNNACVYLNENYAGKIVGRNRKNYDELCEKLHNINLRGISEFSSISQEERDKVFAELEEIEIAIFDSVADEIGVKAELTEAITTTADRKANNDSEVITSVQEEVASSEAETENERITATD